MNVPKSVLPLTSNGAMYPESPKLITAHRVSEIDFRTPHNFLHPKVKNCDRKLH